MASHGRTEALLNAPWNRLCSSTKFRLLQTWLVCEDVEKRLCEVMKRMQDRGLPYDLADAVYTCALRGFQVEALLGYAGVLVGAEVEDDEQKDLTEYDTRVLDYVCKLLRVASDRIDRDLLFTLLRDMDKDMKTAIKKSEEMEAMQEYVEYGINEQEEHSSTICVTYDRSQALALVVSVLTLILMNKTNKHDAAQKSECLNTHVIVVETQKEKSIAEVVLKMMAKEFKVKLRCKNSEEFVEEQKTRLRRMMNVFDIDANSKESKHKYTTFVVLTYNELVRSQNLLFAVTKVWFLIPPGKEIQSLDVIASIIIQSDLIVFTANADRCYLRKLHRAVSRDSRDAYIESYNKFLSNKYDDGSMNQHNATKHRIYLPNSIKSLERVFQSPFLVEDESTFFGRVYMGMDDSEIDETTKERVIIIVRESQKRKYMSTLPPLIQKACTITDNDDSLISNETQTFESISEMPTYYMLSQEEALDTLRKEAAQKPGNIVKIRTKELRFRSLSSSHEFFTILSLLVSPLYCVDTEKGMPLQPTISLHLNCISTCLDEYETPKSKTKNKDTYQSASKQQKHISTNKYSNLLENVDDNNESKTKGSTTNVSINTEMIEKQLEKKEGETEGYIFNSLITLFASCSKKMDANKVPVSVLLLHAYCTSQYDDYMLSLAFTSIDITTLARKIVTLVAELSLINNSQVSQNEPTITTTSITSDQVIDTNPISRMEQMGLLPLPKTLLINPSVSQPEQVLVENVMTTSDCMTLGDLYSLDINLDQCGLSQLINLLFSRRILVPLKEKDMKDNLLPYNSEITIGPGALELLNGTVKIELHLSLEEASAITSEAAEHDVKLNTKFADNVPPCLFPIASYLNTTMNPSSTPTRKERPLNINPLFNDEEFDLERCEYLPIDGGKDISLAYITKLCEVYDNMYAHESISLFNKLMRFGISPDNIPSLFDNTDELTPVEQKKCTDTVGLLQALVSAHMMESCQNYTMLDRFATSRIDVLNMERKLITAIESYLYKHGRR